MAFVKVHFWGTRGSYPLSSLSKSKVGGNTSCVSLENGKDLIILDAGTGLISLGQDLRIQKYHHATLLLSHVHHDHIMGIPFFKPIWLKDWTVDFYCGMSQKYGGIDSLLQACFTPPYFPVPWVNFPAQRHYHDFNTGESFNLNSDVSISTVPLHHPGGGCGYAVYMNGYKIVYLTDTQHTDDFFHQFVLFSHKADLLIYDSTFTDEEFNLYATWGHSTWRQATSIAKASQSKSLALFHHNPDHTDEDMEGILKEAMQEFSHTILAKDGMEIDLGEDFFPL